MAEEKLSPKCDENNPNDPHYADRHFGNYDRECNWIWDIGKMSDIAQRLAWALKEMSK